MVEFDSAVEQQRIESGDADVCVRLAVLLWYFATEDPVLLSSTVMYLSDTTVVSKLKSARTICGVHSSKQRILESVQGPRKLDSYDVHGAFDNRIVQFQTRIAQSAFSV